MGRMYNSHKSYSTYPEKKIKAQSSLFCMYLKEKQFNECNETFDLVALCIYCMKFFKS